MKACVLCDVGRIEVREVPQPRVGARDVLLRIAAVGICGTDAHIFSGHANYNTDAAGKACRLRCSRRFWGTRSAVRLRRWEPRFAILPWAIAS